MKTGRLKSIKFTLVLSIVFILLFPSFCVLASTTINTYDHLNRLTGSTSDDGTPTINYTYDNVGNRLSLDIQVLPGHPLEIPTVEDSSEYSLDTTQLDLSTTTYSPEFGNLIYQYSLGTSCELTDIQEWTEFFPDENGNVLLDALNLPYGGLFITVRVLNFAGDTVSDSGCSDGILVLDPAGDYDKDTFVNSTEHDVGSDPLNRDSRPFDTTIHLLSGFNMVAIPVDLSYPTNLNESLSLIGSNQDIEEMLAYNENTGTYVSLLPGNASNPEYILYGGEGLIVYATQRKEIHFSTVLCGALSFSQGVNLIGVSCPPANYTAVDFLLDIGPENISSIQRFNTNSGTFETIGFDINNTVVGDDFPIVPGEGYFLYMKQAVFGFWPAGLTP